MNILHFLSKELFTKNVLCLDVLPDAVLFMVVSPLLVKKIQEDLDGYRSAFGEGWHGQ